jgi:hypothetical protein
VKSVRPDPDVIFLMNWAIQSLTIAVTRLESRLSASQCGFRALGEKCAGAWLVEQTRRKRILQR